jgi:hypothetical protein
VYPAASGRASKSLLKFRYCCEVKKLNLNS